MDKVLDEQFDSMEIALNVLIESITTANPSISATHDLIAADDGLTEGLTQRKAHLARLDWHSTDKSQSQSTSRIITELYNYGRLPTR